MKKKRKEDQKVLDLFRGSPCEICGRPSDPAHIKCRGSGGDDVPENVISLCRTHHIMQTGLNWARFVQRYPKIGRLLNKKGWELRDEFGTIKLRRKDN